MAGRYRVVVGVDSSPAALGALRWAAGEAARHDGEVLAVHALDPQRPSHAYYAPSSSADVAETRQRSCRHVEELVDAVLATAPPARVRRSFVVDVPARALVSAASMADLLVVGGPRAGDPSRLGPTRRACLQHSPCPVVVVPPSPAAAREAAMDAAYA